jgi:uncharacterized protein (UPF0332 family)
MSPESTDYLGTAQWSLDEARAILEAGHFEIASREAYAAALNAARAIIYEKTGKVTKTHSGARAQLYKLIREGLPFDRDLADFLARGFEVKLQVDYGPVERISRAEAESFVNVAEAFLAAAKAVLTK